MPFEPAELAAYPGDEDDAPMRAATPPYPSVTGPAVGRWYQGDATGLLALTTPLDPRLLEQLAVLLLRHPLATLLDY